MRRNKPKTRQDLFIYVLNKWLDNEYKCISEWGISNRDKLRADARKEYEECLNLWEQLKE